MRARERESERERKRVRARERERERRNNQNTNSNMYFIPFWKDKSKLCPENTETARIDQNKYFESLFKGVAAEV